MNLAFDKAGNLIVVSSGGKGMTVYSFRPDGPEDEITVLEPEPAAERPGMTAILPVNYWVNGDFTNTLSTATYEYVSLDQLFTKVVTTRTTLPICLAGPHAVYSGARMPSCRGRPISDISSVLFCRRSGW